MWLQRMVSERPYIDVKLKIVMVISLFHFKCLYAVPDFDPNVAYFIQ